ncbi:hypothetical protein ACFQWB_11780, partial [Paenibacillus thermoaerophilus]
PRRRRGRPPASRRGRAPASRRGKAGRPAAKQRARRRIVPIRVRYYRAGFAEGYNTGYNEGFAQGLQDGMSVPAAG